MPDITATANIQNIVPSGDVQFSWRISLIFSGEGCANSLGRVVRHPTITVRTAQNSLLIPFSAVRGGDLSVNVSVAIGAVAISARSQNLQVTGTNPSLDALRSVVPAEDDFRKLMCQESGLRQFLSPACPLFSTDRAGGVGICQVTNPLPTDDQIWSWKANVQAGWELYARKKSAAARFPASVRSGGFVDLVDSYNRQRVAANLPKLNSIELPDFTEGQVRLDALRGYNGYCAGLHEFRVKVDRNGLPVVAVNPTGTAGTAEWERVTSADRIAYYNSKGIAVANQGDPSYVENVERQPGF